MEKKSAYKPLSPAHEKPSARDRILSTAARLFESQGYAATGINQIIAESQTAKASFYSHFASKELLGNEYLEQYGRYHLRLIRDLTVRSHSPREFLASWVRLLKRQLREHQLYGCPMANLRAQIGDESPLLVNKVRELTADTLALLADYILSERLVQDTHSAAIKARRVFAAYEGAVQIWKLTGDAAALDDIEVLSLTALGLSRNNQIQ